MNTATHAASRATAHAPDLLADPRTRLLIACSSLPVVIETMMMHANGSGGTTAVTLALLCVCGCLLMSLAPRVGGLAIVAVWVWRCVAPETTAVSPLFCLLMAILVMSYRSGGLAVAAAVVAEAATAARIWLYPWDSSIMATVCATAAFLMVALWIGSMMSWRERLEAEERERAALLRQLEHQQLATELHHSVANDLTTILLLARQLEDGLGDGERHGGDVVAESRQSSGRPAGVRARGFAEDAGAVDDGPSADACVGKAEGAADEAAEKIADDIRRLDVVRLIEQVATESLGKVRTLIAGLDQADAGGAGSSGTAGALGNSGAGWGGTSVTSGGIDAAGSGTAGALGNGDAYGGNGAGSGSSTASAVGTGGMSGGRVDERDAATAIYPGSGPRTSLIMLNADELRFDMQRYRSRIEALGLTGTMMVRGPSNVECTPASRAALLEIMQEIAGNMTKYASGTFCMVVTLEPGLATVSASNGVADGAGLADGAEETDDVAVTDAGEAAKDSGLPQTAGSPFSGGSGLARCRREAERLGGEFSIIADDGAWSCLLKLPLA
ncbi:hypothetical protein [Bifidobacterium leontopitheci]|nr:hypothetical protein [Bifidobacterium leontopitheci]